MKYSIITTTLNCKNVIEKTIHSVLDQQFEDFEYILIDGASYDGTLDVIKKHKSVFSHIVSEPDDGIYFAMNKGLKLATGDFVYFLGAGDVLQPLVLKRIERYIDDNVDVIYGGVIEKGITRTPDPLEAFHWKMAISHQAMFVRRKLLSEFDTSYRIASDYDLIYRLYKNGAHFRYIPIDVAFYMGSGVSSNISLTNREQTTIACRLLKKNDINYSFYVKMILERYVRRECEILLKNLDLNAAFDEYLTQAGVKKKELVLFGTGEIAGRLIRLFDSKRFKIKYFVDSDKNKCGKEFNGYSIFQIDRLSHETDICVFILNERYCAEMRYQLTEMELDESIKIVDYCGFKNFFISKNWDKTVKKGMHEIPELMNILGQ